MKVSEVLRLLHDDGWYLAATRGSHPPVQAPYEAWTRHRTWKTERRFGTRNAEQYSEAVGPEEIR
jgi:hypothetical protein